MGLVHEVSGPIICMHLLISLHVSFFQNSVKKLMQSCCEEKWQRVILSRDNDYSINELFVVVTSGTMTILFEVL